MTDDVESTCSPDAEARRIDMAAAHQAAAESCPPDVREFGIRNRIETFAEATWMSGFIDGWRTARATPHPPLAARPEPKEWR